MSSNAFVAPGDETVAARSPAPGPSESAPRLHRRLSRTELPGAEGVIERTYGEGPARCHVPAS
jgi:hypothetical protein